MLCVQIASIQLQFTNNHCLKLKLSQQNNVLIIYDYNGVFKYISHIQ